MTFDKIPGNVALFIDANIFVYYFAPNPVLGPPCQMLMERIGKYQDCFAYTSTHVLSQLSHQLMVLEATQVFGWPLAGITRRLQRHPAEVRKLTRFRQALDEIPRLGIEVLALDRHLVPLGASLSQLHGLLTNDGLVLASMQDETIIHLASHDVDFDRVPGIKRYAPV
jgi:predicted nucleic acid-binding protein